MIILIVLPALGIAISWYTLLVERRLAEDPTYQPACDLSDTVSCSKPIKSRYSKVLFGSNARMGVIGYGIMLGLALFHALKLLVVVAGISLLVSLLLAYFLYVKIRAFCLLCTSLYLINIALLIMAIKALYS